MMPRTVGRAVCLGACTRLRSCGGRRGVSRASPVPRGAVQAGRPSPSTSMPAASCSASRRPDVQPHGSGPTGRWRCRRQAPVECPCTGRAPDRIGSLCDDACPTAGTPDTALTERLRAARLAERRQSLSRRCGVHRGMVCLGIRI